VKVGIDERTERFGALKPGIEFEPELPRQRQVRTLACGGNDAIDRTDAAASINRFTFDGQPAVNAENRYRREAGNESYAAAFGQFLNLCAQLPARGQLIGVTAAVNAREIGAARRPNRRRAGLSPRQPCKIEQSIAGRVSATDDQRRFSGIRPSGPTEDIGNSVGNAIGERRFSFRRKPARAKRIGCLPRAGRVYDRPGAITAHAGGGFDNEDKGSRLAILAHNFVDPEARDRGHVCAGFDDAGKAARGRI
jgi:hypothetical protein